MKISFVGAVLSLLLGACAANGEGRQDSSADPPPAATACAAQGGTWKRLGMLGRWQCEFQLSDAGQTCRASSDCQGACLAPEGSALGQAVTGHCAATEPLYGCYARVDAGLAEPALCVD